MTSWRDPQGQNGVDVVSGSKVMVNNDVIFTVTGEVLIEDLYSECNTGNDTTASTLQYKSNPTTGAAATFSAASATLASALAGATVVLAGTLLSTAPVVNASGPALGTNPAGIIIPAGTISLVIGVGSTTGTWHHVLRYHPLTPGAVVVANQQYIFLYT